MYKILAVLLLGFVGGALSPWVLSWAAPVPIAEPSDAVAVANTFIVFTTFFFVGITVVLAVAGFVFTQQFSATKETHEIQALNELKDKIKSHEQTATSLLDALLENPDVKRHIETLLQTKIDELINERLADSQAFATQAAQELNAVHGLAAQLRPNNIGVNNE
ncbi:hypothetical protein [Methylomonas sp. MgM2]